MEVLLKPNHHKNKENLRLSELWGKGIGTKRVGCIDATGPHSF